MNPHYQDIKQVFKTEFEGMPFVKISLQELEEAREKLVRDIHKSLTDKEKKFIVAVKKGETGLGIDRIK